MLCTGAPQACIGTKDEAHQAYPPRRRRPQRRLSVRLERRRRRVALTYTGTRPARRRGDRVWAKKTGAGVAVECPQRRRRAAAVATAASASAAAAAAAAVTAAAVVTADAGAAGCGFPLRPLEGCSAAVAPGGPLSRRRGARARPRAAAQRRGGCRVWCGWLGCWSHSSSKLKQRAKISRPWCFGVCLFSF